MGQLQLESFREELVLLGNDEDTWHVTPATVRDSVIPAMCWLWLECGKPFVLIRHVVEEMIFGGDTGHAAVVLQTLSVNMMRNIEASGLEYIDRGHSR